MGKIEMKYEPELVRRLEVKARQYSKQAQAKQAAAVMRAGTVPAGTSPLIEPFAPGRGFTVPFRQTELIQRADGKVEEIDANHLRLAAIRIGDAFDRTADACVRNKVDLPFSPGQIAVGRAYAALVERYESAGLRCASGETQGQGGGGSFMDAVLADSERLARLERRIGAGLAVEVRKVRPSARGGRRAIRDRVLVRSFCCEGLTLADVLKAHGWSKTGSNVQRVRIALCAALDRMQGGAIRPRMSNVRYFGEMNGPAK